LIGIRVIGETATHVGTNVRAVPAALAVQVDAKQARPSAPVAAPAPQPSQLALEAAPPTAEPPKVTPAHAEAPSRPRAKGPLRDVVWSDRQQALVPIDAPEAPSETL
jgi:hypothetical protein